MMPPFSFSKQPLAPPPNHGTFTQRRTCMPLPEFVSSSKPPSLKHMKSSIFKVVACLGILLPARIAAQNQQFNLAGASLEDLLNAEVTSVSKKAQALSRTGASVFVI